MRLNRSLHFIEPLVAGFLIAALVTSCTAVQNPALEAARESYQKARRDPLIARNAGAALDRAEQTLQTADRIWTEEGDVAEVEHLSYIVEKRVEIARLIAERRSARDEMQQPRSSR
jgi:ABC-type branched-subunit amino acid transport system ATPase component